MLDRISDIKGPGGESASDAATSDLRQRLDPFRRRIRSLILIATITFLPIAVLTLRAEPSYTATTMIMIDPRHEKIVESEQVLSGLPAESSIVDTEVEILKSRALAEKVVDALDLRNDPEFNADLRPRSALTGMLDALKMMGHDDPTPERRSLLAETRRQQVTDRVQEHVHVARSGLTYIITLGFQSKSAVKAALIANCFADRYLGLQLETKFDATRRASDWLNSHLANLRDQVQAAETAVAEFKAAHGLMGLANAEGTTMTQQEISNLDRELAAARVAQAEADAKLATAKGQLAHGSKGDDVGAALTSQVVQELRRQRAAISGQRADLEGRYGPKHPEMRKIERQLSDIDQEIQGEIRRIISNLEAEADVARGRSAAIGTALVEARERLVSSNSASVRLNELERNADSVRTLYQSFLDRFKQTSAQQGVEQSDARIVSRATPPTRPTSPRLALYLVVGAVVAGAAASGAILVLEALEQGLYTAEDVEALLGVPALGVIPSMAGTLTGWRRMTGRFGDAGLANHVAGSPFSAFSEAFRTLRAGLFYAGTHPAPQIIALTSALPAEGKTTTALCLGRIMALDGVKTLLIDCDVRQRGLTRALGLNPRSGLLEVLRDTAVLESSLIKDRLTDLEILPLTATLLRPEDLLSREGMSRQLAVLRQRYDVILLDTAPLLAVADTRVLAMLADRVLFLVEWKKTPRKAAERSMRSLRTIGATVAGSALTRMPMREQARLGYGDVSYYHRRGDRARDAVHPR